MKKTILSMAALPVTLFALMACAKPAGMKHLIPRVCASKRGVFRRYPLRE